MVGNTKVAMPLAVLLQFVQKTKQTTTDLENHLFCSDINKRTRHQIQSSAPELPLHFESLRELMPVDLFPTEKRLGQETWGRFFAANYLAESRQTAVYLDTNILVRKDLSELFKTRIGNHSLAAVTAISNPTISSPNSAISSIWRELHIAPNTPYLQSGALVFKLTSWKDRNPANTLPNSWPLFPE